MKSSAWSADAKSFALRDGLRAGEAMGYQSKISFRRDGTVRARTLPPRLTRAERTEGDQYPEWADEDRPITRGQCAGEQRPCPWVSCRHHLYLDVVRRQLKENFPGKEVWDLEESCSLDIADRGGITLDEVGARMNIVRERVRQIEMVALTRIRERVGPALDEDEE